MRVLDYEVPMVVEVGEFTELTQSSTTGPALDGGSGTIAYGYA